MLLWHVRKRNSGFTLIEMITVVIIIGVIAAITSPNLLGLLYQNRINQAMRQIEGAVREAQKQATRQSKTCKIRFTTTGTGNSKRSIVQVRPDENIAGVDVSYSGCLLDNRELPRDISIGLKGTGIIEAPSVADLGFSAKGNPDVPVPSIMYIEHPNVNDKKCVEIRGMFGKIISGNYNSTTEVCTPPPAS